MPSSFWVCLLAPDEPAAHQAMMDHVRLGLVRSEEWVTHEIPLE
jgi:hypothetical protein